MSEHPDTIHSPEAFDRSQWNIVCPRCGCPIGFDGIFHWGWLKGIFPRHIMPMDFDGVIEFNRHYLVFETKDTGQEIPIGQYYTLERLREAKSFTVMQIWGKIHPESFKIVFPQGAEITHAEENGEKTTEEARAFVKRWRDWAGRN